MSVAPKAILAMLMTGTPSLSCQMLFPPCSASSQTGESMCPGKVVVAGQPFAAEQRDGYGAIGGCPARGAAGRTRDDNSKFNR